MHPQKGLIRANAGSTGNVGTRTGMWSPDTGQWVGMVVVEEGRRNGGSKRAEQEMKPLNLLQSLLPGVGVGRGRGIKSKDMKGFGILWKE